MSIRKAASPTAPEPSSTEPSAAPRRAAGAGALHVERINSHRTLRPWSLLGLVLVPLLVAGLLLGTAWGRTSRLHQINAAVVNSDQAVTLNGQMVPLGRQLAAEIVSKPAQNVSWTLSDPADAAAGLASGKYAVVVTIPKNFSAAATSVKSADSAEQATIDIATSPAAAVEDAQIARQVAQTATQSTNAMLTGSYLDNIYVGFNTMGKQLTTMANGARQLSDGATKLSDGTSKAATGTAALADGLGTLDANGAKLGSGGSQLASGATKLQAGATGLSVGLGQYTSGVGSLVGGLGTLSTGVQTYTAGTGKVVDGIGQLNTGVQRYTAGTGKVVDGIGQLNTGVQAYTSGAGKVVDGIGQLDTGVQQLNKGVQQVPTLSTAQTAQLTTTLKQLSTAVGGLQDVQATLRQTANATGTLPQARQAGAAARQQCLAQPNATEAACTLVQQQVSGYVDQALKASAKAALQQFQQLPAGSQEQIRQATGQINKLPAALGQVNQLKTGVAQLAAGSSQLAKQSQQLKSGGTTLAKGSAQLATQSQQLKSGGTTLAKGSAQLASQSQQLKAGGTKLADGVANAASQAKPLVAGGSKLAAGANQLAGGAGSLASGTRQYADGVAKYTDGVHQANTGAQQLSTGMTQLTSGSGQLATGLKTFSDGVAKGATQVPSYSASQRETLSKVVATPVTGDAAGVGSPLAQVTSLLLVLAAWLGAMLTWLVVRPIASRTLTSSRPSWQLAGATMLPGALVALAQAVLLGILGARVLHLGFGRGIGLVAFLCLAGLAFTAVNHALAAWLGGVGRTIAVILGAATAAVGLVSAVPGLVGALHSAGPLAPALDGVRSIVAHRAVGVGPIGILLFLALAGAALSLLAVVRRRQVSPARYRRAAPESLR